MSMHPKKNEEGRGIANENGLVRTGNRLCFSDTGGWDGRTVPEWSVFLSTPARPAGLDRLGNDASDKARSQAIQDEEEGGDG